MLKKILYNIKVLHYLYLNYPNDIQPKGDITSNVSLLKSDKSLNKFYFNRLFAFCVNNYDINNIILVIHPGTDNFFIELCKKYNFQIIELNSMDYKSWKFDNDSHWNCFGHKSASSQVYNWIDSKY